MNKCKFKLTLLIMLFMFLFFSIGNLLNSEVKCKKENALFRNYNYNQKISKWDVGSGDRSWEQHILAPYVDMTSWTPEHNHSGAPSLIDLHNGIKSNYFNLGFIQAYDYQISNQALNWGWGGYSVLNENNNGNSQYQGIKKSIREIRDIGGDVIISFGGASGIPFWLATNNVDVLANTYIQIIEGYGLTKIDLDIEGAGENIQANKVNAQAIKLVQEKTGVDVFLTLPVMDYGLTLWGYSNLLEYVNSGINIDYVNLMTMNYGSSVPNYAQGSIDALDSTMNQVISAYKFNGINLTNEEAYARLGATPSIGFESNNHPIFTINDSKKLINASIERNIGLMSYWVANRDAKIGGYANNQGISNPYEFGKEFRKFKDYNDSVDLNPPSQPMGLSINKLTYNLVGLSWNNSIDDVGIKNYKLNLYDENEVKLLQFYPTQNNIEIHNLKSNTNYFIDLHAQDLSGNLSQISQRIGFKTLTIDSVTKPEKPNNLKISNITIDSAKLTFENPNEASIVDSYKVVVYDKDNLITLEKIIKKEEFLIANLKENSEYNVSVVATHVFNNQVYYSDESWINFKTLISPSNMPQYDPLKIYHKGEQVSYEGIIWEAKWYINQNTPPTTLEPSGSLSGWKIIDGTIVEWNVNGTYIAGDLVYYNGHIYKYKYWSSDNSTPDNSDLWILIE